MTTLNLNLFCWLKQRLHCRVNRLHTVHHIAHLYIYICNFLVLVAEKVLS